MSTAKTRNTQHATRPMTCPVCGEPILPGQSHRNTVYKIVDSVPSSAQAHYPVCYLKKHPQARQPIPAQPSLFAATLN